MKHSDLKCNMSTCIGIICKRYADLSGILLIKYLFNQIYNYEKL